MQQGVDFLFLYDDKYKPVDEDKDWETNDQLKYDGYNKSELRFRKPWNQLIELQLDIFINRKEWDANRE
jgi:hypothetical protein